TQAADHSIATLHRVHSCLSACLLAARPFSSRVRARDHIRRVGLQDCVGSRCVPLSRRFCWLLCEGFMYTKSLIVVLPGVDSTFAKVKFRHYCLLSILAPAAILSCRWH
uniref:Secreted protein n=1 Tax=Macrostomum lignano TaxID=282301 RepID=A0A1I8F880_9PLAT